VSLKAYSMFACAAGRSPANVARTAIVSSLVALAALCQGGCAASGNVHYATAPAVAAYAEQVPTTQTEGDGLPSQPPPAMRIRQMPDDPSEPYSRNYGGANPAAIGAASEEAARNSKPEAPVIPADLPPAFRHQLAEAGYVVD
jgi:hypothetical protein